VQKGGNFMHGFSGERFNGFFWQSDCFGLRFLYIIIGYPVAKVGFDRAIGWGI
jgi:hypothetical protein